MNYYERHIGDYLKDTAHLSLLEHGIYTRLMDVYYTRECGIDAADVARLIGARAKDEKAALSVVLAEFFVLVSGIYVQARCDREIERYQDKQRKAKASADARWSQSGRNANALPDAMRTHSEGNALQSPVSSNQLNTLEPNGSCQLDVDPEKPEGEAIPPKAGLPACPHTALLGLWKKHLPDLRQPRVWDGNRKVTMRNRWQQAAHPSEYSPEGYATEDGGLKWWDSFFGYIARDTSLARGFESAGRTWTPDLEWVCNATNFQKIIDGKYTK